MAMNFLYSTFVAADPSESQEVKDQIITLKDRLETSTLLSDRQTGIQTLKTLATEYKKLVGELCLEQLGQVLETDASDATIIRACLETFSILFTIDNSDDTDDLGIVFSGRFAKNTKAVFSLLNCLESSDFYVKYSGINVIQSLHSQNPSQIEIALLASPGAISLLVDLLDDEREVIRNDGLLLLTAMTASNVELQKIIAFHNVFEKLLDTIQGESGLDGGIVVEDCFQLIMNLNQNNPSNQNYFRETSCIQRLPEILSIATEQSEPEEWENPQKLANLMKMLQLIRLLTQPRGTNTKPNQLIMERCGLVSLLVALVALEIIPVQIRSYSFFVLGNVICDFRSNQELVGNAELSNLNSPPTPFLTFVTATVLFQNENFSLQLGAAYLFQCYLSSNLDAQLALASTLRSPPGNMSQDYEQASVGNLIINALSEGSDSNGSWLALLLMAHLIHGNTECKQLLLNTQIFFGEESVGLLGFICQKFMATAGENAAALESSQLRLCAGYLTLLSFWLHNAPSAVAEYLKEGANFQFLIELSLPGSGTDHLLHGLSSFLLTVLYSYHDDNLSPFDSNVLRTIILKRVGSEQLTNNLLQLQDVSDFRDSRSWSHFFSNDAWNSNIESYSRLDHRFVEFFKANSEGALKHFIEGNQPNNFIQAPLEVRSPNTLNHPVSSEFQEKVSLLEARVKELQENEILHLDEISKLRIALEKADAYILYLHSKRSPKLNSVDTQSTLNSELINDGPELLSVSLAASLENLSGDENQPQQSEPNFSAPISQDPISATPQDSVLDLHVQAKDNNNPSYPQPIVSKESHDFSAQNNHEISMPPTNTFETVIQHTPPIKPLVNSPARKTNPARAPRLLHPAFDSITDVPNDNLSHATLSHPTPQGLAQKPNVDSQFNSPTRHSSGVSTPTSRTSYHPPPQDSAISTPLVYSPPANSNPSTIAASAYPTELKPTDYNDNQSIFNI